MSVTLCGPTAQDADARILIVDTHLAAEVAATLLPAYAARWPSEDLRLHELSMDDLLPLNGLDILLWPTNVELCRDAMTDLGAKLLKVTDRVRMVYVNGTDEPAFSLAAMSTWTSKDVVAWAKARAKPFEAPPPAPDPMEVIAENVSRESTGYPQDIHSEDGRQPPSDTHLPSKRVRRGKPRSKRNGQPPGDGIQIEAGASAFVSWEQLGLDRSGNGAPFPHLANIQRVLMGHPHLTGRIWYDEFHDRVFQTLFQEGPAEWADHHDTRLTIWLQAELRLAKMGIQSVRLAVDEFARHHVRNEPKDWMLGLEWDGTERLPTLMADGWGAEQNEYSEAVGRCWLVSMAARILSPGCQADYMPVFEGPQGLNKSSALRVIGGKWYAEAHESVLSKDFYQNLQGRMLLEVTEMDTFSRAEVGRVKAVISCPTDRYRSSYGRRAEDHPRRCIFGGSVNGDDWVKDDTGARRFWPILCGEINLEYLRQMREQLFAEAVAIYNKSPADASPEQRILDGSSWWNINQTLAKAEQDQRREADPWTESVLFWCAKKDVVRVPEVLSQCLLLPLHLHGKSEQMRVSSILRVAGWKRRTLRDRLVILKCWANPGGNVVTAPLEF